MIDEIARRGLLEVLPLTHIRGRSLHDSFVIVDEAQSLERGVLLTVLSRLGAGSRVVLTHDVAQRDNLRVGRHDGVTAVIEALKGHPLFAHVTLTRSERSPIAELVTEMLEDLPLLTRPLLGCCSALLGSCRTHKREQHPEAGQPHAVRRADPRGHAVRLPEVRPRPPDDAPALVADRVLPALLLEDRVTCVLAGP